MEIIKGKKKFTKKKYNLSLDSEIIEELKVRLEKNNISLSGYVNAVLTDSLEAMKTLPDNVEDMTMKQFTDFLNLFMKKVRE